MSNRRALHPRNGEVCIEVVIEGRQSPLAQAMEFVNMLSARGALADRLARRGAAPPEKVPTPPQELLMTVTHQVLAVTPEMAAEMLAHNVHNRPLRPTAVEELADDMRAGRWHMTGDAVKFDKQGRLLDGQHRLAAIVTAQATVPLLVVRGLDVESQDYMDLGRKRTIADALTLEGKVTHRPAQVGAIARAVLLLEMAKGGRSQQRPTHAQVLDRIRQTPVRFEEAAYVSGQAQAQGLRGGIIYGLAYYYLADIDGAAYDAERFFEKLISGADLHPGQPIYALRQKLIREAPRVSRQAHDIRTNLAYIFKAWNAYRTGKPMIQLRMGRDEEVLPV